MELLGLSTSDVTSSVVTATGHTQSDVCSLISLQIGSSNFYNICEGI